MCLYYFLQLHLLHLLSFLWWLLFPQPHLFRLCTVHLEHLPLVLGVLPVLPEVLVDRVVFRFHPPNLFLSNQFEVLLDIP